MVKSFGIDLLRDFIHCRAREEAVQIVNVIYMDCIGTRVVLKWVFGVLKWQQCCIEVVLR